MDTFGVAVDEWQELVAAADRILLFLDFDGTLAPIVPNPGDARLPETTLAALRTLSEDDGITLVFVSGRSLADLQRRVGVAGAIYAGNHGLEIEGRGIDFVHNEAAPAGPAMRAIEQELRVALAGIPGILIENKGPTLSVHYRRVPVDDFARVANAVQQVQGLHSDSVDQTVGRKVFEFRPRTGWDKGAAAKWIRERVGCDALANYIGDDRTDEDAFRALKGAVTIHTGESGRTAATYRLDGPEAVGRFLKWLGDTRRKG
jgi:trehalose-phosphatase